MKDPLVQAIPLEQEETEPDPQIPRQEHGLQAKPCNVDPAGPLSTSLSHSITSPLGGCPQGWSCTEDGAGDTSLEERDRRGHQADG